MTECLLCSRATRAGGPVASAAQHAIRGWKLSVASPGSVVGGGVVQSPAAVMSVLSVQQGFRDKGGGCTRGGAGRVGAPGRPAHGGRCISPGVAGSCWCLFTTNLGASCFPEFWNCAGKLIKREDRGVGTSWTRWVRGTGDHLDLRLASDGVGVGVRWDWAPSPWDLALSPGPQCWNGL